MSWSLLLLKQFPKNWTTELPATDPIEWAQILKFHSLTQDKEGNNNTALDNNEFINDIKNGNYPRKGLRGTVKQLEEWKENPTWRRMLPISKLFSGASPVTRGRVVAEIIDRFVKEVLGEKGEGEKEGFGLAEDWYGGKKRAHQKGKPFQVKSKWNNTDSIIATLEGKNPFSKHIKELNKEQQRELLDDFNSKIYRKSEGTKDKKLINETIEYMPDILNSLGYRDLRILEMRKPKNLSDEEWGNINWEKPIQGEKIKFTKSGNKIISDEIDYSKINDEHGGIKSKIETTHKVALDKITVKPLPIVALFGIVGRQKEKIIGTTQATGKTTLSQVELLQQEKSEFDKYVINPNFDLNHTYYFYSNIMHKSNEYVPDKLENFKLLTGRSGKKRTGGKTNPVVLQLLSDTYSNIDNVFSKFMTDSKSKIFKNETAIKNHYINQLSDNPKIEFNREGKTIKLPQGIQDTLMGQAEKERKKTLKDALSDSQNPIYTLLRTIVKEDKEITNILPFQINKNEINLINRLSNFSKVLDEIAEDGMKSGVEMFRELEGLSKGNIKTKGNIKYLPKDKKSKLDNFIVDIKMLSNNDLYEVFGDDVGDIVISLKEVKSEEVKLPMEQDENKILNEFLTGLEGAEKDIGEWVYYSHLNETDFRDNLRFKSSQIGYSLQELFSIITKLGTPFRGELGSDNYYTLIEDLDYDDKKSDEEIKQTIKELYSTLERDIPKVRELLKEEAKNKVINILKNPTAHLGKETRGKARMKSSQSLRNLLSKRKLIVEANK